MATLQPPSAPPTPNIRTVKSETTRIINAHYPHFLDLSVLFIHSLIFCSTVFLILIDHIPNYSQIFNVLTDFSTELGQPIISTKTLLLFLAYYLITSIFSLCAIGSTTYSVFHLYYGQPVKLISAIKSISASFFPLLGTLIVAQIIAFAITISFMIILFLVIRGAESLGLEIEFSSSYFQGLLLVLGIVLIVVFLHLQVIVSLAYVVVVVESKWGLQSLRRSASLLKGMKRVAIYLLLILMTVVAVYSWQVVFLLDDWDGWKTRGWIEVLVIVYYSGFLTVFVRDHLASNTLLYIYCKAIHGELAFENAEEFGRLYVRLPLHDDKAPHLASVE